MALICDTGAGTGCRGRGGVPRAQRDEFPQLALHKGLMTKKIRLCADTKDRRDPRPARGSLLPL